MRSDQYYRNLMRLFSDTFPGYEFLVSAQSTRRDLTRFANSEIHQNVSTNSMNFTAIFLKNKKIAIVSGNDDTLEGLKRLKEQVDEIMENSPEVPFEFKMPPLRMEYPYYMDEEEMKNIPPETRAKFFDMVKDLAASKNLKAFGYVANTTGDFSVFSTTGLFLYMSYTSADFNTVLLNESGSGSYTSGSAKNFESLDIERKIKETVELATKNVPNDEIDPGSFTVILGPEATATLFMYFAFGALNGLWHELGTSSSVKFLGKKVGPDFLNFKDDPNDERLIKFPFDAVGSKRETFPIIENGTFKNVLYPYGAALMFGKEATGHTFNLKELDFAFPANPVIGDGTLTKEELFSKVDKGLYIHRFHYVNIVDPSSLTLTGMTRDGLFLVERGEITKAVKNMRFNVNFYELMKNLKAFSKEQDSVGEYLSPIIAPYALFEGFTFTSKTDH